MADGFIPPMLAVTAEEHELGDGFAYEFKWDGVRAIARVAAGKLTLWSRRGNDITVSYPELDGLASALPYDGVLDGEVVAFDDNARPSFSRLQRRMHVSDPGKAAQLARSVPVAFLAFDLLELAGEELLDRPYVERRERLESLDLRGASWQVPPRHDGSLDLLLQVVDDLGLEGVVAKRPDSIYRPGVRSPDWRKHRRMLDEPFVVGGYRTGEGRREGSFGSLLIGYHDPAGDLRFAGSVGSGFTDRELERLERLLIGTVRDDSPFVDPVPHPDVVFVEPRLVAVVRYREFTPDGILRQPSYKGLVEDADPAEVVREDLPGRAGTSGR